MSKNVQTAILHIVVGVVCFIGALIVFNSNIGEEKGSAVSESLPTRPIRCLKSVMIRAATI